MRLKKLILHGFKSFADRVEVSFENGITGVVGPNGCGKSNISDAVRWVLGEQSAKTLRGAKMEDVIFNGTEKRRRLAYCEVSLIFDNTDHSLPIDFTEVSVVRRVYRSGEGEYKLNGTACRLRDIVDLFRDTGIGKDGYSLIGQGRIDEILSAKSDERRQVFEEAAGIVKYKARKIEAQRRMEHTRENLARVEDILSELNARVEPLKRQSEKAREYLALRDELKILDLNVFLVRSERYETRLNELRETVDTLAQGLEQANAEIETTARDRDAVELELGENERETGEKRDSVQELIREVEASEGAVKLIKERISTSERERDRVTSERDAAKSGRAGLTKRIVEMGQLIDFQAETLSRDAEKQKEREAALEKAEKALKTCENEAETLKQEIMDEMNRLGDVKSAKARYGAMITALQNRLAEIEKERNREKIGADSLDTQVSEAETTLESEKERLSELRTRGEKLNSDVRELTEKSSELGNSVQRMQSERQQKDSRLKLLREMQRDYDGYNNSVKQVLLQARRLPNSGVHGVVADLIHVPERLERAMDMVLGAAVQNVVVDRDEDAKRMIEYLRANRFGRATFLPISSVRGHTLSVQERSVLNMPGCIGLASELITFDKKYQGVVDNLLGRTVVAEDLTTGIAIQRAGRYQFRLVTLEGDVMHSGGSMTGGSVQSRMTSLLSRTREIEETAEAVSKIDKSLSEAQTVYADIENRRAEIKRERGTVFDEFHQQEISLARAEAQLNAIREERDNNAERVKRAEHERERLTGQLKEAEEKLKELESRQESAEKSSDDKQSTVREMQNKIYRLRTETDGLRNEVNDARVALASGEKVLENRRADRDRFQSDADNAEKILAESGERLERCAAELEEYTAKLAEDEAHLKEQKDALKLARTAFDESDARRVKAQEKLKKLNSQIEKTRVTAEELSEKHHRSELLLTRIDGEFKSLRDRIWEDYELTYANAEPFRQADFKLNEAEKRAQTIRQSIKALGAVNVGAVDEYRSTCERVEEMTAQRDDLNKAQDDLQKIVEELERKMEVQFKEQFALMNENFQKTFVKLFGGGKAELQLSDPKDALNCGIEIVASPPGKKLQSLSLLSGGERALTAIAILFAILDLKPTPFCILDEIEAALDDANIDTYADYLKAYSANTQFIVITHRKGTMERCNALYGVVMEEKGVSKTVSVRLNDAI